MIEPVVAPTPTGTVEIFLDGLGEGTNFLPLVWMAFIVAVVGLRMVLKLSIDEYRARRKYRKTLKRANA